MLEIAIPNSVEKGMGMSPYNAYNSIIYHFCSNSSIIITNKD
jgi:hypothetical protein